MRQILLITFTTYIFSFFEIFKERFYSSSQFNKYQKSLGFYSVGAIIFFLTQKRTLFLIDNIGHHLLFNIKCILLFENYYILFHYNF